MKDTDMTSPKQIRGIGMAVLAIALALALGSAWAERQARIAPDAALARQAESMATRLFTLATVFILIGGYEFQRARTVRRFSLLEQEMETLRSRVGSAA